MHGRLAEIPSGELVQLPRQLLGVDDFLGFVDELDVVGFYLLEQTVHIDLQASVQRRIQKVVPRPSLEEVNVLEVVQTLGYGVDDQQSHETEGEKVGELEKEGVLAGRLLQLFPQFPGRHVGDQSQKLRYPTLEFVPLQNFLQGSLNERIYHISTSTLFHQHHFLDGVRKVLLFGVDDLLSLVVDLDQLVFFEYPFQLPAQVAAALDEGSRSKFAHQEGVDFHFRVDHQRLGDLLRKNFLVFFPGLRYGFLYEGKLVHLLHLDPIRGFPGQCLPQEILNLLAYRTEGHFESVQVQLRVRVLLNGLVGVQHVLPTQHVQKYRTQVPHYHFVEFIVGELPAIVGFGRLITGIP